MPITFQNQDLRFNLKNRQAIRSWLIHEISRKRKRCGDLNFVFTTDEALFKVNVEFLNHHTYTDIITFDSCEGDLVNGDIMISIDRVRDNAAKFAVTFDEELHRVLVHGVLHLCGYKDKTRDEAALMRKLEGQALRRLKQALI